MAQVKRKIEQIIEANAEGVCYPSMKDKCAALVGRVATLEADIESAVRIPPRLADLYCEKLPGWRMP